MGDALTTKRTGFSVFFDKALTQGNHRILNTATHGDKASVGLLIGFFSGFQGLLFLGQSLLQRLKLLFVDSDFSEKIVVILYLVVVLVDVGLQLFEFRFFFAKCVQLAGDFAGFQRFAFLGFVINHFLFVVNSLFGFCELFIGNTKRAFQDFNFSLGSLSLIGQLLDIVDLTFILIQLYEKCFGVAVEFVLRHAGIEPLVVLFDFSVEKRELSFFINEISSEGVIGALQHDHNIFQSLQLVICFEKVVETLTFSNSVLPVIFQCFLAFVFLAVHDGFELCQCIIGILDALMAAFDNVELLDLLTNAVKAFLEFSLVLYGFLLQLLQLNHFIFGQGVFFFQVIELLGTYFDCFGLFEQIFNGDAVK